MYLLFALAFGVACALIANSKGRSWVGWLLIGFFFGLIGLIICLCMSNLNEERQYRGQQAEENRRLREKLRQEQLKLESMRRHTAERLDLHDKALNMDTRSTVPAMLGAGYAYPAAPALTPPPLAEDPVVVEAGLSEWYFVSRGEQCGPVSSAQLTGLIQTGQVLRDTLIWQQPMSTWAEAGRVQPFASLFTGHYAS